MLALVLYFFAAAALGEHVPNIQLLKAAYFLFAGVAWAWPGVHFVRWMQAEPAASTQCPRSGLIWRGRCNALPDRQ